MKNLMNFAVAKIRARESRLIKESEYIRLNQSRNTKEFLKLLSEFGYNEEDDFDKALSNELSLTYDYIKEALKEENDIIFPFLLKYDLFNMGVYLKAELSNKDFNNDKLPFSRCGNYETSYLVHVLRDDKGNISSELKSIVKEAKEIYLNTGDISFAQIHLDKKGYEYILSCIKKTDSPFIKKYFMIDSDIKNLIFSLRLMRINSQELIKEVLISGGYVETDKIRKAFLADAEELGEVFKKSLNSASVDEAILAFLEGKTFYEIYEILESNLINLVDATRLTAFGIDPIVAYMLRKEYEIKRLRKIYYSIITEKQ